MGREKILITGSAGQIGTELVHALRAEYGDDAVVASDIKSIADVHEDLLSGPYETLDITDAKALGALIDQYSVTQIYHLAAILSAKGEQNPQAAWDINMGGLFNVLEGSLEKGIDRVFWPSSIAVFGLHTPKARTPQQTVTDANSVYGISKLAGERWVSYYFKKRGLDVRSVRYPGIISHSSPPGGGTTDYAVQIYYGAIQSGKYECFLSANTRLPMMYMPDAIRATMELMQADPNKITIRSSYNLAACSFTPAEQTESIKKEIPDFEISYAPDYRQAIADTWPESIDDTVARAEWGWKEEYDLDAMTSDMLVNLRKKLKLKI